MENGKAREGKGGILKSDRLKAQNSGSSENKDTQECLGQCTIDRSQVSPQPSVDRLSVTWAEPELSVSSASTKINLYHFGADVPVTNMEAKFPSPAAPVIPADVSEDEDYSASINAIMLRRGSTRRSRKGRGRRPSSPFLPDAEPFAPRRRSSVFTTSSGDTAISIEEVQPAEVTQEQIYENIRLHKEVLSSVKLASWSMRKKLKLVHQARTYIKRHEGQLQERLAQSKSTRDIMARCNILLTTKWQHMKREAANLSNLMIPWELRIKEIESHFGSVVASYFTFLRWLFWVNLVISVILVVFVIVPEILTADVALAGERKVIYEEDKNSSVNLLILWEFEGVLKCSPIFYGYYTNIDTGDYRLPLAYFMTGLAVYVYSFVATLRKMAENSRMSKLSEKEDECIFSWKLFTGWDFMIGNAETANNRTASIILSFKEALLEEAEKKKDPRNWRVISLRVLVNVCVLILLVVSAYAVVTVVNRSNEKSNHWWRQNEITIVMSLISNIFPIFFEILGFLEHYHPRKQLRIQLGRIMILNLLNIFSLIFALFSKIDGMTSDLADLKPKENASSFLETPNFDFLEPNRAFFLQQENETHACYWMSTDCQNWLDQYLTTPKGKSTAIINDYNQKPEAFKKMTDTVVLSTSNYQTESAQADFKSTTLYKSENMNSSKELAKIVHKIKAAKNTTQSKKLKSATTEATTQYDISDSISANTENYELVKHLKFISSLSRNTSDFDESPEEDNEDNYDYNTIDINNLIYDTTLSTTDLVTTTDYTDYEFGTDVYNDLNEFTSTAIDTPTTEWMHTVEPTDDNINISSTIDDIISNEQYNSSSLNDIDVSSTNNEELIPSKEHSTTYSDVILIDLREATISTIYDYTKTELNHSIISSASKTTLSDDAIDAITSDRHNSTITESTAIINTLPTAGFSSSSSDNNYTTVETKPIYSTEIIKSININNITKQSNKTSIISNTNRGTTLTLNQTIAQTPPNLCYILICIDKRQPYNRSTFLPISPVNSSRDLIIKDKYNHTLYNLTMTTKQKLLSLCWETMFGQELVKLTMMDLVLCILGTLFVDFFRAVFVRYMNRCWCWDLEKKFPQYGDFKIAENILHLVNNQGMVWMGLFFSPGLAVLNLVKLVILMYLRSWAVMTCNVPHEVVFRASRSNNFYLSLLLTMLFLCVLPVGYAIVWVTPSWHCGPFSEYDRIYRIFTVNLNKILPETLKKASDYIASPGIVIPLLVLLILIIYYLTSLTNSLREANNDLKTQLRRERTEERRKMYKQMAERSDKESPTDMANTPFEKWKKILPILTTSKSVESDERKASNDGGESAIPLKKKGDIFAKIVSMAFRRPVQEEPKSNIKDLSPQAIDDETDTEFHESLPDDVLQSKDIKVLRHDGERTKRKANVEFKTTSDGKIKEEVVSAFLKHKPKIRTVKVGDKIYEAEKPDSKAPDSELKRSAQLRFKSRDLIKAKLLEEAEKLKEMEKSTERSSYSLDEKEDIEITKSRKIKKKHSSDTSSQSKQSDSVGSVIPVITISKTESDDDMLEDTNSQMKKKSDVIVVETIPKKTKTKVHVQAPKDQKDHADEESLKCLKKMPNPKGLIRQSSVDSINDQKANKEKKADEGHKFQYSL